MSDVCAGGSAQGAIRRHTAALRSARGLHLAASPTFAVMALLTLEFGDAAPLCGSASPLGGMVPMYLLMSAFHLPPWIRLIAGRHGA